MPIATPEVYNQMLDTAKKGGFAFPAINCTSSETINAALRGFAEARPEVVNAALDVLGDALALVAHDDRQVLRVTAEVLAQSEEQRAQ